MAANTAPIFTKQAQIEWATLTAANNVYDGTGTVATVFTADATEGSRVDRLVIRALGTNVASVLRLFVNNGGSNAVAANNALLAEISLPATTAAAAAALMGQEYPLSLSLPPGYKLIAVLGTAVAAGIEVTALGGKY